LFREIHINQYTASVQTEVPTVLAIENNILGLQYSYEVP